MKHIKLFENFMFENLNSENKITIDDLRKAYTDGQNSVQVKMKQKESYDEYGDMILKLVGEKEITKKFEDWLEENWD